MPSSYMWTQRVRFYIQIAALYMLTIGFAVFALRPDGFLANAQPVAYIRTIASSNIKLVAGIPVRISIPSENVNLTVVEGYYVPSVAAWTLSGSDAEYANGSSPANNIGGNTFIYGHNNDSVFGALRHVTPTVGSEALVYTSNGHILDYSFQSVTSVAPYDVAALTYNGPSILTIQTCTGSINQWRTLYRFTFDKVIQ